MATVAQSVASMLLMKHESATNDHHTSCLGAILHEWLSTGGGAEIHEDYTVFLQLVAILLYDRQVGLPSGCWKRRDPDGVERPLTFDDHLGEENWFWYFERDVFDQLIYEMHQRERSG